MAKWVGPMRMRSLSLKAFVLLVALFFGACSPQKQEASKHSDKRVTQPTPFFYPQTKGPFPAILLLPTAAHDISGENAIARDLAAQGYVARSVSYGDMKFSGIFNDPVRMNRFKQLASESLASLKAQPEVDPNRIGVMGYSMGGWLVTYLASSSEKTGLKAAVIYYGTYNVPEQIKNLRVPILAFQGDEDQLPGFVQNAAAMKQIAMDYKKQFELVFYPRAGHGFDRRSDSPYQKIIAKNSWARMLAFLDEHVKQAH
jgi:dienelactone hydrolase